MLKQNDSIKFILFGRTKQGATIRSEYYSFAAIAGAFEALKPKMHDMLIAISVSNEGFSNIAVTHILKDNERRIVSKLYADVIVANNL